MKINGKDIIIFMKEGGTWKTMALGTSCDLDVNCEVVIVSSPYIGKWRKVKKKRITWTCSSGHLVEAERGLGIIEKMKEGTPIRVAIASIATTAESRDFMAMVPDGRFGLQGDAIINRVTVTGKVNDYATISVGFTGSGELLNL